MLSLVHSLVDFFTEVEKDENQDLRFTLLQKKCLCDGALYEDENFPADVSSLCTENKPEGYEVDDVVWLRPKEIVAKAENPEESVAKFINDEPTRFDVRQGALGDCWLLSSIANLPTYKTVFARVVPPDNVEFEDENYCGIFHFRFWQYGEWVDVVIDDRLPTSDGKLIFVTSEHTNVFWSALVEKAYAKLHGCYEKIDGGWTTESFEDFTGGITEYFNLADLETEKVNSQQLFDHVKFSLDHSSLICVSADQQDENTGHGIVEGHAYSLTGAEKLSNGTLLVRIRNPWGDATEWTGDWCDGSKEWDDIDEEERENLGLTFDADGEYWMPWEECRKYLPDLEIGHFNPFCVMCVDGNKERVDSSVIHTTTLSGAWSEQDIVEFPEAEENNEENEENDNNDEDNEIPDADNNEEEALSKENEISEENDNIITEEKIVDHETEETEAEKDEIEDIEEKEEESKYMEATQSSQNLAKSLQFIISLTKPEDSENDEETFKVVFSIMLKNRRQLGTIKETLYKLDFDLFDFDKNERNLSEKLSECFFDNNQPFNSKQNYNLAHEIILSYKLPVGEYCAVLTSGIQKEYFIRIYSEANVSTHQLLNTSEEENEI